MSEHLVRDPRNRAIVGCHQLSTAAEVRAKVGAARDGQSAWARVTDQRRREVLAAAADLMDAHRAFLADVLSREQGKPEPEALSEIRKTAEVYRHFARRDAETEPHPAVSWHPLGVVAAIVPNNYPATLAAYKTAPALAAGCAVIVKPDLQTPAITGELVGLLHKAGVPETALQLVYCSNEVAEQTLVGARGIDALSFTGSTAAGVRIAGLAYRGGVLPRLTLELGGANTMVVTAGADLSAAADAAVSKAFRNAGQVCHGISRVLVDRRVHDQWLDAFLDRTHALRPATVGGAQNGSSIGPLTTPAARRRIESQIRSLAATGARIHRNPHFPIDEGWFTAPTVLAGSDSDPDFATELFGPAVLVQPLDGGLESAVELINRQPGGLASYLYGGPDEPLAAAAARIQCGTVAVGTTRAVDLGAPFCGWNASGLGGELGANAVRSFQKPQHTPIA